MEIATGKFKTHCLQVLRDVEEKHEEVVITKRGKPIARLVPVAEGRHRPLFGWMKGRARIIGDIVAPTGEKWNADE